MAKIYKLEYYFVDYNDRYESAEQLIDVMSDSFSGLILNPSYKVSSHFEWHDDINLNQKRCSRYDCEQYFRPIYFEENDWFEDEDLDWIEEILEEIGFDGLLDNMEEEKVRWTLTELKDLYETYSFKARTQSHNDADTYYDFLDTCGNIKQLIDYLMMFYEEVLKLTKYEKAKFGVYDLFQT